jgi:hypothetical protein
VISIKTTGLEDYLDGEGGTCNIKVLVLGRPGSGKTRAASYWKRPLLIDLEDGRAVLADRGTPYVRVRTLKEAEEALLYVRKEAGKPSRIFDTVIVDTIDALQLISVRERLKKTGRERLEALEGDYDSVNQPLKAFIAGLLELDLNVVVNAHVRQENQIKVKDSKPKPLLGGDTVTTAQAWAVDLVGGIREQAAGWFDLVALLENEWDIGDGTKVIRRHLRWQPIPELPFLKDRLYAFPPTTPVDFADTDYTQLADAIAKKALGLKRSVQVVEVVGEPDIVARGVAGGPVTASPSGVLPKPRKKPEPEVKVEPPTPDEAVATVEETLGGQVVDQEALPRDYAAEAEQVATRAEVKDIWNAALEAGALTPPLKARLTVIARSLVN